MKHGSSCRIFIFCVALAGSIHPALCVNRLVEFRDGSRMELDLPPVEFILHSGVKDKLHPEIRIKLDKTSQITFSETPALKRVERITSALQGLRDENFAMRESAALLLTRLGSGFRELLEEKLKESFDPEIKWRLRRVLKDLPIYASDEYDHVRIGAQFHRGQFKDWQVSVDYRGSEIILNRQTVRTISVPFNAIHSKTVIAPVRNPDSSLVPLTGRKVDFERYPTGESLRAGDNIQNAFADWGITLATSVEESYVSVHRYDINGSGGGNSAATHKPLYEGTITINFCKPGDPTRPAGVTFVGCWLGLVKPGGTSMIAYGMDGKEIGKVLTVEGTAQFIGIKSKTPIGGVKIVPNPDIDTTFALDDLVYDIPSPSLGALKPAHFSLLLTDGNKINCRAIKYRRYPGRSNVELHAIPGVPYADEIRLPINNVQALVPPQGKDQHDAPVGSRVWSLLSDGSRLILSSSDEGELKSEIGNIQLRNLLISSLWASPRQMQRPPDELRIPRGGAAIILRNDPLYLTDYKVGNEKFSGTRPDGSRVSYSYNRLPTIWISEATPNPVAAGRIVLTDGQIIYFGERCLFKSCQLGQKGITISDSLPQTEDQPKKIIMLDFKLIRSVHFH